MTCSWCVGARPSRRASRTGCPRSRAQARPSPRSRTGIAFSGSPSSSSGDPLEDPARRLDRRPERGPDLDVELPLVLDRNELEPEPGPRQTIENESRDGEQHHDDRRQRTKNAGRPRRRARGHRKAASRTRNTAFSRRVFTRMRDESIGSRVNETNIESDDRDGYRQGERREEPADDAAHERDRDEHRDDRERRREDGERDLARCPSRAASAPACPRSTGA